MVVLRDEDLTWEDLGGFMISFGRMFYKLRERSEEKMELTKRDERFMSMLESEDGSLQVALFRSGEVIEDSDLHG